MALKHTLSGDPNLAKVAEKKTGIMVCYGNIMYHNIHQYVVMVCYNIPKLPYGYANITHRIHV